MLISSDTAQFCSNCTPHWRLNVSLLHDDDVVADVSARIQEYLGHRTPSAEEWEAFKRWVCPVLRSWGRKKARDRSDLLNRLAAKIRIVRRGEPLTPLMREYLKTLEERYLQLFQSSSGAARRHYIQAQAVAGPGVVRYLDFDRGCQSSPPPVSSF